MTHESVVTESVPAPDSLLERLQALERRQVELAKENEALRKKSERDDATIQRLERENRELRGRLDQFIRKYFGGTKSEGLSAGQLELTLQGLPATIQEAPVPQELVQALTASPAAPKRERRPRHALDDDRLEQRETVLEPEEVKADPTGWKRVSEERTAQLDYQPGKLFRHVIVRPRYVRSEQFAIAPLPAQPIDKGMVGAGLLAWLLVSKFVDHLPMYRLASMLRRQHGIEIPRNTLNGWSEQAADLLGPIYRAMRDRHRGRSYLQVDETPVRYLDPETPGESRRGYLWVYLDPGGETLFQWSEGRAHEAPKEFLGDFRGVLQVDGYSAYEALVKARGGEVTLAYCWAHARRGLVEAQAEAPRSAAWLLRQIQAMYLVEETLRAKRAGPALRTAVRASQTRRVVERVFRAIEKLRPRYLPGGAMAKALDYILERREGLKRFVDDGRLEIDSNRVENAIRPCALGRKNWLFVGHPGAGDRAAIFYSLMASCRRHGIDPTEYLKDVLTRLPSATTSQVESFIPAEWAKARRSAAGRPKSRGASRP